MDLFNALIKEIEAGLCPHTFSFIVQMKIAFRWKKVWRIDKEELRKKCIRNLDRTLVHFNNEMIILVSLLNTYNECNIFMPLSHQLKLIWALNQRTIFKFRLSKTLIHTVCNNNEAISLVCKNLSWLNALTLYI